jgi:formylglycine-generating enzyme required for sulfatase activity
MFKRITIGSLAALMMVAGLIPAAAQVPGSGDTTNMVLVPAGYFMMGTTAAEFNEAVRLCQVAGVADCPGYFEDELPARQVYTDAFYVDMFETTNAEYAQCVAAGVCSPPRAFSAYSYPSYYNNPAFSRYPVIHVTWYDADTYCRWRGKRLLTEAEWEKAARWDPVTEMVTVWPWGNQIDDGTRLNLCDQECAFSGRYPVNDRYADIAPVGTYPRGASHVGAYNMAGNVWEWVADYYDAAYYVYGATTNPAGPPTGTYRIRRGGAFNNPAAFTRSANRKEDLATVEDHQLGIRCGMDAGAPPAAGQPANPPSGSLYIGGQAFVNVVNDTLALRTGPNTTFAKIEELADGTRVTIIDGPQYGGGYTWWYLRAPSGNMGWAVDYADGIVTLIPIQ